MLLKSDTQLTEITDARTDARNSVIADKATIKAPFSADTAENAEKKTDITTRIYREFITLTRWLNTVEKKLLRFRC
jgi:hypothetical protein